MATTWRMATGLAALFLVLATAGSARAQAEVGIAYQFQRVGSFAQHFPAGLTADFVVPILFNGRLGLVGEAGWSRLTEGAFAENLTHGAGGIRAIIPAGRLGLYGQALGGAQRDTFGGFRSTDAMLSVDGGVSIPVWARGSVFGQAGWRRVFYGDDAFGQQDAMRIVAGARVRF